MIAVFTGSDVYLEGSLCAQDQDILANAFPRRTREGHEDVVVSSSEELGIRGLRRLPERQPKSPRAGAKPSRPTAKRKYLNEECASKVVGW